MYFFILFVALYGPLHGGANEAVLDMLIEIGSPENVSKFLASVKNKEKKLMGFGHRVYRNYDPRAKIIRRVAYEVFEVCGEEPLIDVAKALEKAALEDSYFVERKLYPNVDFYSGLIYRGTKNNICQFTLLFAALFSNGISYRFFPGSICDSQNHWMVGSLARVAA